MFVGKTFHLNCLHDTNYILYGCIQHNEQGRRDSLRRSWHETDSGGFPHQEISVCQVGLSNPNTFQVPHVDSLYRTVANILFIFYLVVP